LAEPEAIMVHEVTLETVAAQPFAAVRRRVLIGEIASAWKPALDQVWAFLRRHPALHAGGHNVFLYRHPARREDPMEVDFGVQVVRAFPGEGEVIASETPAGEVATALHVGPYTELAKAHTAIHAWRAANGRDFAGHSWEVYGDWSDDPARLETRVFYLLR
jgi:effector-binding domain-containing protein